MSHCCDILLNFVGIEGNMFEMGHASQVRKINGKRASVVCVAFSFSFLSGKKNSTFPSQ